ncbi:MAG TPA: cytochrome c3 family protein [Vicinamibacterales bacterium]|nr:cytochrome c3 family protein [Vicinamibacterales bacterium]
MTRGMKAEGRGLNAETGRHKVLVALIAAIFWLQPSSFCLATNGAFRLTRHGDSVNGPQRVRDAPAGSCVQCHDAAGADGKAQNNAAGLFAANDNELCFTCHSGPGDIGSFPGRGLWSESTHARSASVYLSTSDDSNKCINCHDPHGVKDSTGLIPAMLRKRDGDLCVSCHNGSRARIDIASEYNKAYHHPFGPRGRHNPSEGKPGDFAAAVGNNRHSDCSDCHNAHRMDVNSALPSPPQASSRLAGVSRVQVVNGGAGVAPNYTWRAADDPAAANEYEICFKCHSSWTTQPAGQSNLAILTNPANPSYHPIQAAGKNARIDPRAFVNGMAADSIISCTDCHSSDDRNIRGPHGSSYAHLLKKPSTTTTSLQPMTSDDICFDCHSYDVYGNGSSPAAVQGASRFNTHVLHVAGQKIPCYDCHETHGSTRRPALIAQRIPGISSFTQNATGGTCVTTCHPARFYSVAYAR